MTKNPSIIGRSSSNNKQTSSSLQLIAHCDCVSVCFKLEDTLGYLKEISEPVEFSTEKDCSTVFYNKENSYTSQLSPDDSDSSNRKTCNWERFSPLNFPCGNDILISCDGKFINESYGTICNPSPSVWFEQANSFDNHIRRDNLVSEIRIQDGYQDKLGGFHDKDTSFNDNQESKSPRSISSSFYPDVYDHNVVGRCVRYKIFKMVPNLCLLSWDASSSDSRFYRFEYVDYGALFYRSHFYKKDHVNFFGETPNYGPIAISIKREMVEHKLNIHDNSRSTSIPDSDISQAVTTFYYRYRIIFRTSSPYVLRSVLPEPRTISSKSLTKNSYFKEVIELAIPKLSLSNVYQANNSIETQDQLLKIDEIGLILKYKIGVMYCAPGQTTESEMYSNDKGSKNFEKFLTLLGPKVELKNFTGYNGQLDTMNDFCGTHSIYTKFHNREIMFHVSTMLPDGECDSQHISKKRYIGNDIVTIIFLDHDSSPFTPSSFKSQFQHVFIVIKCNEENVSGQQYYKIGVSRTFDVPMFGPPINQPMYKHGNVFREFLLTKIINGENAAYKARKFSSMALKTRNSYLKDLCKNYITNTPLFHSQRQSTSIFKNIKKLDKNPIPMMHYYYTSCALTWNISLFNQHTNSWNPSFICLSAFNIQFIDRMRKVPVITILNRYVQAFRQVGSCGLRIYHRGLNYAEFKMNPSNEDDLSSLIYRLKSVTDVVEAKPVIFYSTSDESSRLIVDEFAVVKNLGRSTCGTRANSVCIGDRILEIDGIPLCLIDIQRFNAMVEESASSRLLVIPARVSTVMRRARIFKKDSDSSIFNRTIPKIEEVKKSPSNVETKIVESCEQTIRINSDSEFDDLSRIINELNEQIDSTQHQVESWTYTPGMRQLFRPSSIVGTNSLLDQPVKIPRAVSSSNFINSNSDNTTKSSGSVFVLSSDDHDNGNLSGSLPIYSRPVPPPRVSSLKYSKRDHDNTNGV